MFVIRTRGTPTKIQDLIIPGVSDEPLLVESPEDIQKIKGYLAVNVHLTSQFLISKVRKPEPKKPEPKKPDPRKPEPKKAEPKKAEPKKAAPKAKKAKPFGRG